MIEVNEPEIVREYLGCPPGAVMVDVGAHYGGVCRPFLQNGWQVLAFEPDPDNRAKLERLAAEFPSLRIDPRAVSDTPSEGVYLYRSAESSGISSLTAFTASHEPACRVETVTLAAALAGRDLGRVDFLKVDVEGLDLEVLRGFPWESIRPDVVIAEFEDRKTLPRYGWRDIAAYMTARRYDVLVSEWAPILHYGPQHVWSRFSRYPCELEHADGWGNLVGFRDGIDWDRWSTAAVRVMERELSSLRSRAEKMRARGREHREEAQMLQRRLDAITGTRLWRVLHLAKRVLRPDG